MFSLIKDFLIKNHFFNENIKQPIIKDKLKDLTNNAFEMDIFGAPTFIVNKKLFWGQDMRNQNLKK